MFSPWFPLFPLLSKSHDTNLNENVDKKVVEESIAARSLLPLGKIGETINVEKVVKK